MTFLVERLAELRRQLDHLETIRHRIAGPSGLRADLTLACRGPHAGRVPQTSVTLLADQGSLLSRYIARSLQAAAE